MRNRQLALATLLSLALLNACGKSPEQARRELGELDIPYTPEGLQQAVQNQDRVAIDLFFKAGFNVSPALPLAVRQGNRELVKKLLDNNANPNYENGTPLWYATSQGDVETAKLLLERGANPNLKVDLFGFGAESPLEEAASKEHLNLIKLLLERGANPNDAGANNSEVLLETIMADKVEIVKILLEKGANPKSVKLVNFPFLGTKQITAFNLAKDNPQILQLLQQHSSDSTNSNSTPQVQTENNASSHTPSQ